MYARKAFMTLIATGEALPGPDDVAKVNGATNTAVT
jgi:hypothetical protein